jgi:hypothetical protein
MRWLTVLSVFAVAMFVAVPSFASVLFMDNFETGAHGDVLDVASPGPGTWALSGSVPGNSLRLAIPTAGGGLPASVYGAQYGATIRGMPEVAGGVYNYADAPFAAQSNASDLIRFEAEIYGQDGNGSSGKPVDLKLSLMSAGTETNSVVIEGNGSTASISVGDVATSLTWGIGNWHHVTMDYHPTASTFDLSIDDQSLTGLAMATPSAVDAVRFSQTSVGQDRWSVFDNVQISVMSTPEPSAIALMVTGLLGLVAYAWRKRR